VGALAQETGQGPTEFVGAFIEDWETEEVYKALFMETLRQSTRFALADNIAIRLLIKRTMT
jgi:hypothetical protein